MMNKVAEAAGKTVGRAFVLAVSLKSQIAIGAIATMITFLGGALDYVKKALEIKNLLLDIAKAKREQGESDRLIQPASASKTEQYQSYTERTLRANCKKEQAEKLSPKAFIAKVSDEREER